MLRRSVSPFLASLSLVGALGAQGHGHHPPPTNDSEATAKLFMGRCASCHTVPDPAVATDRAWLDQVKRTAWTSTPAEARAALIEWLSKQEAARPRRLDAVPNVQEAAGKGLVGSSFGAGSAVLTGDTGSLVLLWKASEDAAPRAVSAGDWHIRTVRIERTHEGTPWFLSMTAPDGKRKLRVEADRPAQIAAEASVHFDGRAERKAEVLQLGFVIVSADHRGLSVYRDGKRVPVRYRVLAEDGAVLATGTMNYGWGGGGWASVKLTSETAPARVEYELETGPFARKGQMVVPIGKAAPRR